MQEKSKVIKINEYIAKRNKMEANGILKYRKSNGTKHGRMKSSTRINVNEMTVI